MAYSNDIVDPNDLPNIDKLKFESLDDQYRALCVFESLFGWIFAAVIIAAIKFLFQPQIPGVIIPIVAGVAVVSAIYSYHAAIAKGFILRERDILYCEGIFWRTFTSVSFKRIQHIDINNGPIERHLGLATLKLYTAGGQSADLAISGLPITLAENIRAKIIDNTTLK